MPCKAPAVVRLQRWYTVSQLPLVPLESLREPEGLSPVSGHSAHLRISSGSPGEQVFCGLMRENLTLPGNSNMLGERGGFALTATYRGCKNPSFYRVSWVSGHSTYRLGTHEFQDNKLNAF